MSKYITNVLLVRAIRDVYYIDSLYIQIIAIVEINVIIDNLSLAF